MKSYTKKTTLLFQLNLTFYFVFVVLMFLVSTYANGQSVIEAPRKYKVTAYKMGDHSIISQSNTAKVAPPLSIYIPNAFTPNNDGLNDGFGVAGQGIHDFEMKIFNNWGELIFETKNPNEKWDGTYRGERAPVSVYIYNVSAKSADGDAVYRSGNLSLLL